MKNKSKKRKSSKRKERIIRFYISPARILMLAQSFASGYTGIRKVK